MSQWDIVAMFLILYFHCTVVLSSFSFFYFFFFFSFFLFVFTKRGSDSRAPVKFFLSHLKSFKTQPSERGLGPNWRRGEEIWREAVRKISAGETERGRGQHRLFVHDSVCVLADTLLFPWCQSPSGGWINGVGLTWVRRGMQMVCVRGLVPLSLWGPVSVFDL